MELASLRTSSLAIFTQLIFASHDHHQEICLPSLRSLYVRTSHRGTHILCQQLYLPNSNPSSSSAARASAPAMSARPQREAATKARKRVEEAYTLYPSEQGQDSDSDATPTRPSAPRPTPVQSDDSSDSDSDVFVDDSEREGESKAGRLLEMDDGKANEDVTGSMVTCGNMMEDILVRKAGPAPRVSSPRPREKTQAFGQHPVMRRAGLSDMGPVTGSHTCGWRDEVWNRAAEGFAVESRKGGARGPGDGSGYRASRFCEHL
ncbi:hypothetical protein HO173_002398 [Letharia columbiana]|uniref:Uncharacterized protein n=1 Tax=Letharia columbiana TaxID=112416 RepID=A0A8H6G3P1_9LECA|nr:uncharacterized protein HO173_002398 [Letharia columbiana]KAF6239851.1 hypothetical protein HO173_002398 [Letharia columbiana]